MPGIICRGRLHGARVWYGDGYIAHFIAEENRFRVAITNILNLVERGEHGKALKLLDDSIAEAKRDHDVSWIRTL